MITRQQLSGKRENSRLFSFENFLSLYLGHDDREGLLSAFPTLEELKMDYINYLLDITDENIEEVADILRLPKESLSRKLNHYQRWL